jgi:hypothetical protein
MLKGKGGIYSFINITNNRQYISSAIYKIKWTFK